VDLDHQENLEIQGQLVRVEDLGHQDQEENVVNLDHQAGLEQLVVLDQVALEVQLVSQVDQVNLVYQAMLAHRDQVEREVHQVRNSCLLSCDHSEKYHNLKN
jgi:hypothetical protein